MTEPEPRFRVEFRLSQLLASHNIQHHGIRKEISEFLGCKPSTVSNWLDGDSSTISLGRLEGLCEFLIRKGIDPRMLPAALIGPASGGFFHAIGRHERVALFLGEFHRKDDNGHDHMEGTERVAIERDQQPWLAKSDILLHTRIVDLLYNPACVPESKIQKLDTQFVPITYEGEPPRSEITYARSLLNTLPAASLILGGPRSNLLIEAWCGTRLFRTTAFPSVRRWNNVPLHVKYNHGHRCVSSCFASSGNPPPLTPDETPFGKPTPPLKDDSPGVYYLTADPQWVCCPVTERNDVAVVITRSEIGSGNPPIEAAIWGYTGRATGAIANHLATELELAWPMQTRVGNVRVGVHVFQLEYTGRGDYDCDVKRISLGDEVLTKCLGDSLDGPV